MHQFYEEIRKITRVEHMNNQAVVDVQWAGGNEAGVAVRVVVEGILKTVREEVRSRKKRQSGTEGERLNEAELLHILFEVSQGLAYAKTKEIAHGNITPDKIGKSKDGRYKLVWLEILVSSLPEAFRPSIYQSPEFGRGSAFPSDVYSLGITMLFLAGLGKPFVHSHPSLLPTLLSAAVQALPYSLSFKNLIASMAALDPAHRPSIEQVSIQARRPYVHFVNTPIAAGDVQPSPVSDYNCIQVDINGGRLDLFDCEREEWKDSIQVAPTIDVQLSMAFAFLPNTQLFICGGIYPASLKAWQVSLRDHQIQLKPPMSEPRYDHAAQYAKNCVYVFGGRGSTKEGLFTAEKYVLNAGRWEELPRSPYFVARATPCLHNDFIIIPGGFGTDIV
jgi:hypothetical protein